MPTPCPEGLPAGLVCTVEAVGVTEAGEEIVTSGRLELVVRDPSGAEVSCAVLAPTAFQISTDRGDVTAR